MASNRNPSHSWTWAGGQPSISAPVITKENVPSRLALTATCLFFSENAPWRLLLCNPHPDSWNTWMLPYGASSIQLHHDTFSVGMHRGEIEAIARNEARSRLKPDILERAMLDMAGVREGTPITKFMEVYEIKVSASANTWTLYYFLYYFAVAEQATPKVQHHWVTLGEKGQMAKRLLEISSEKSLPIEPNVFEALKTLEALPTPLLANSNTKPRSSRT